MRGIQRADIQQRLQETLGTRGTVVEEVDSTIVPVVILADISERTSDAGPVVFSATAAAVAGQASVVQIRNPETSGFDLVIDRVGFRNDISNIWIQRVTSNADEPTIVAGSHGIVDGRPSTTGSGPKTPFVLSTGSQGAIPTTTYEIANNAGFVAEFATFVWPSMGWRIKPGQALRFIGGQVLAAFGLSTSGRMEPIT
jgi:hypothetical protein